MTGGKNSGTAEVYITELTGLFKVFEPLPAMQKGPGGNPAEAFLYYWNCFRTYFS